jgi:hypothetical protein
MTTYAEHREFSRSPIDARTEVRLRNGITVEGKAVDVSLRGLMLATEDRLPVGKPVRVMLILEGNREPKRINAGGHIARLDDAGVAVCFTDLDLDNTQYLRDLITLNAPTGLAMPVLASRTIRKN